MRGENKWRVLLIFDKETMLDEIANLAYSNADAAKTDDETGKLIRQYIDIIEEGNIKRVDRTMVLAATRCERLLYKWTKHPFLKQHLSLDNHRDRKSELLMELTVSDSFSENIATSLLSLVNEFIEIYVLRDWAGITYKDAYEYWDLRLRDTEEQILKCLEIGDDDDAILYAGW